MMHIGIYISQSLSLYLFHIHNHNSKNSMMPLIALLCNYIRERVSKNSFSRKPIDIINILKVICFLVFSFWLSLCVCRTTISSMYI